MKRVNVCAQGRHLSRAIRSRYRKRRAVPLVFEDEVADRDARIATEHRCDQSSPNRSRSERSRVHGQAGGSRFRSWCNHTQFLVTQASFSPMNKALTRNLPGETDECADWSSETAIIAWVTLALVPIEIVFDGRRGRTEAARRRTAVAPVSDILASFRAFTPSEADLTLK